MHYSMYNEEVFFFFFTRKNSKIQFSNDDFCIFAVRVGASLNQFWYEQIIVYINQMKIEKI